MTDASSAREPALRAADWPGVNALAAPLVTALVRDAAGLRLGLTRQDSGALLIDAGIAHAGGIEAGRRIAEICLAGLGSVTLLPGGAIAKWPWQVSVHSAHPVLACLGSQYAGWSLTAGEGKAAYHAMGSGPGRAAAAREPLFDELGYRERAQTVCLILETDTAPPDALVSKVAERCAVEPAACTFILTPTRSLAGAVQIVARVLEVALHKAHALGFPLARIVDGMGSAPLCPPSADFLTAMGRSNDAILFGGQVHLFVDAAVEQARELAEALPASASRDYGKPFRQVFKDVGHDFYKIDPHLFAPAVAQVTEIRSGRTFRAGALDVALLAQSFA